VQLDLDGYPVTVIDTAGIRETKDPVEQEGVRRARARAAEADLVLWMNDPQQESIPEQCSAPVWRVRNKVDLGGPGPGAGQSKEHVGALRSDNIAFGISASRGDGIDELIGAIVAFAKDYLGTGEGALIGRERQRKLLEQVAASLRRSMASASHGEELAAEDLRAASYSLGRLLGRVDVDDILDVIFRQFCIGK
jgi:tRNA modification GTPase